MNMKCIKKGGCPSFKTTLQERWAYFVMAFFMTIVATASNNASAITYTSTSITGRTASCSFFDSSASGAAITDSCGGPGFGKVEASASLYSLKYYASGANGGGGSLTANFYDTWTISGGAGSSKLFFDVDIDGSFTAIGDASWTLRLWNGGISYLHTDTAKDTSYAFSDVVHGVLNFNYGSPFVFATSGSLDAVALRVGSSVEADFLHTIALNPASLCVGSTRDSCVSLTESQLTTVSGVNPLANPNPNSVSEPPVLPLVAPMVIALMGIQRKRQRSRMREA